jgi:pimeloyl-ACP methyl ester carboxylesterase
MREVEDMQAIITKTGASNIFGLSSGGLVALRTTLATSAIQKVVLYEPPFCVNGSVPTSWVSRFDSEVAQGKLAEAVITALKGTEMEPTLGILGKLPRFVLVPLMSLGLMLQKATCDNDDVSISTLIPTQHFDMQVVKEMSDTLQDYSSLQAEVLLLGGTKSPAFLKVVLDDLGSVLPHVKRITLQGLGHDGSENDGRPDLVAGELRQFFSTAAHLFSDSARPILRSPSISDQITQLLKEEGEIEEKFRTQELDRPFNKSSLTHSKPSNEISGVKNQYDEIALDKKF